MARRSHTFVITSTCKFVSRQFSPNDAFILFSAGFDLHYEDSDVSRFIFCLQSASWVKYTSRNQLTPGDFNPEILRDAALSRAFEGIHWRSGNNVASGMTGRRLLHTKFSKDQTRRSSETKVKRRVLSHDLNMDAEDSSRGQRQR